MINYSVSPQVNPQDPEAKMKLYAKAQYVKNLDINVLALVSTFAQAIQGS